MRCPECKGEGWVQTHATGGGPCGLGAMMMFGLAETCRTCGGRGNVWWPVAAISAPIWAIRKHTYSRHILREFMEMEVEHGARLGEAPGD